MQTIVDVVYSLCTVFFSYPCIVIAVLVGLYVDLHGIVEVHIDILHVVLPSIVDARARAGRCSLFRGLTVLVVVGHDRMKSIVLEMFDMSLLRLQTLN